MPKNVNFHIPDYLIDKSINVTDQIRDILKNATCEFDAKAFQKASSDSDKTIRCIYIDDETLDFLIEYKGIHGIKSLSKTGLAIVATHRANETPKPYEIPFYKAFAMIGARG